MAKIPIDEWLDATASLHNGLKSNDFEEAIIRGETKAVLARRFGVSRKTIYQWMYKYGQITTVDRQPLTSDILDE